MRSGDADEFRHHVGVVDHHQQHHEHKGEAQAELLADQVAEALAGDHAHAGAHLLHHDQGDGDGNHRPEQGVAVLRAGLGVGEDAAGVVIHVGGNESGAEDGQKQEYPDSPTLAMRAVPIVDSLRVLFDHNRPRHAGPDAVLGGKHIRQIAELRAIDDRAAELEKIVHAVIVRFGGMGRSSESISLFARPIGLDDAPGDDGNLLMERVDAEGVNGVAEPIEIAADGGGRTDRQIEGKAVLVLFLPGDGPQ